MADDDYSRRFDEDVLAKAAEDAAKQIPDAAAAEAVASLATKDGLAVQVVGRVVDGKLEIDPASLDVFAQRFPNARATFVAVNAPFDREFSAQLLNA